jgi:hypothetical protein
LQFEALSHSHFDACIVVAYRQQRCRLAGVEQGVAGMELG